MFAPMRAAVSANAVSARMMGTGKSVISQAAGPSVAHVTITTSASAASATSSFLIRLFRPSSTVSPSPFACSTAILRSGRSAWRNWPGAWPASAAA
ncbi:hypothetical protein D3C85_1278910 [compost metagenome]